MISSGYPSNTYPIECPLNFSALFCGRVNCSRHRCSPGWNRAGSGRGAPSSFLCCENCEGRGWRWWTASGGWRSRVSAPVRRLGLRLVVVLLVISEEEEVLIFFISVGVRLEAFVSFQSIVFLVGE